MKFRQISDELVIITDDIGTSTVVSIDEAKQLGYKEFTYQNKRISSYRFAQLIGRPACSVDMMRKIYGYCTGEEIIEHYEKLENNKKQITYQGKPIAVTDFAKLIGKPRNTVKYLINRYNYHTGEEIIEHYNNIIENSRKYLTYQGKLITVIDFAKLIGKTDAAVVSVVNKYKYRTGEEVIEHYNRFENNKPLTYYGKPITITDFAKLIGKTTFTVSILARKYKYHTGEEIIEHYNKLENSKKLTYQGKPINIRDFAKLIGKAASTIGQIAQRYNYHTGEEIIEHYRLKGKLK